MTSATEAPTSPLRRLWLILATITILSFGALLYYGGEIY